MACPPGQCGPCSFRRAGASEVKSDHLQAAGLVTQRQHREIVWDHSRELRGYGGGQLVWRQLRHKRIRDVEQRSQPVPLPDCFLPGEEGLDGDGKFAGDSLQECQLGWSGIEGRHGAEAESAEPVIAGSEGDEHSGTDPEVASERVRTPASESQTRQVRLRVAAGSAIPNPPDPGRPASEGS